MPTESLAAAWNVLDVSEASMSLVYASEVEKVVDDSGATSEKVTVHV